MDVKSVFRLVDVDKSGNISRTVKSNIKLIWYLKVKFYRKPKWQQSFSSKDLESKMWDFQKNVETIQSLLQVPTWVKKFDEDSDGRLSYKEFKLAILPSSEENEENETDQ